MGSQFDIKYRDELLAPLRKCAEYRPKFGAATRSNGDEEIEMTVEAFRRLYGSDPLYSWIGLDSPLMYAAHKAAGGMTSVYRQLGIGCERLARAIIRDTLKLDAEMLAWTYEAVDERGKPKKLTLDARIDAEHIVAAEARERFTDWLKRAGQYVDRPRSEELVGVIFEVRQGYKSADSKRQNADLAFGTRAALLNYLPSIMVMSTQISVPVIARYRAASMLVLTGLSSSDDTKSTFAFFENVVGYSLSKFFERNSAELRREVAAILQKLLSPS